MRLLRCSVHLIDEPRDLITVRRVGPVRQKDAIGFAGRLVLPELALALPDVVDENRVAALDVGALKLRQRPLPVLEVEGSGSAFGMFLRLTNVGACRPRDEQEQAGNRSRYASIPASISASFVDV